MPGVKGRSGGHNAKSVKNHKADGTFRPDRHGLRMELYVDPEQLDCPFEPGTEESQAWLRIVESLPVEQITRLDFDKLFVYAEAWAAWRKVWPEFKRDPLDKDTRITALNLMDRVITLGREFGTSPMARMSLKMPVEEKEDKDPLTEFLKRKNQKGDS